MEPPKLGNLNKEQLSALLAEKRKEICRLEQELLREIDEESKEKDTAVGESEDKSGGTAAESKKAEAEKEKEKEKPCPKDENKNESNKGVAKKGEVGKEDSKNKSNSKSKAKSDEHDIWKPPTWCIPIRADVRNFDFKKLAETQKKLTGRLFDVIMTDPPWQLATSNPTRGVAIGYQQLADSLIRAIPFGSLQDNGFLFIWVINVKYKFALDWAEGMGYKLVDEVVWVKSTVNRRLAKSHGFYLQHAKETCLVFRKGDDPPNTQPNVDNDVIYSVRRGQSQKPVEIYEMIERFVPGGTFLEIFGRRNNLRDYWCTIGNEL